MKAFVLVGLGVFTYILFNSRYHVRCDGTVNDPVCGNMFSGAMASFQGK